MECQTTRKNQMRQETAATIPSDEKATHGTKSHIFEGAKCIAMLRNIMNRGTFLYSHDVSLKQGHGQA
jgi:hypothetical protein